MTLIIVLIALGLILISVEFFIPGGIVGVAGVLLLLGAVGVSYGEYGIIAAGWVLLGCMAAGGIWAYIMFGLLAKTRYGRKLFLQSTSSGRIRYGSHEDDTTAADAQTQALIGKEGVALTAMSPTGRIELNGSPYEATSQSGFLERGTKVRVVSHSSFGLIVRKI